jgi:2'-hydroxyisoflavone reductase
VSTSRRRFLKASVAAGGAAALGGLPSLASAAERLGPIERAQKSLNLLILGGTGFTGPEQVEYAIKRGHKVTLLNRNRRRPDFFKGRVEQLVGDLNEDVSALKDKKFDVVIDNPTTAPAWVRNAAQYLKGNTNHYIFISTISVYKNSNKAWADETDATTPMPDGVDPYTVPREQWGRYYGALKTASEQEAQKHYPGMTTIIRPGLIVGPLDTSDRFTYWPYRIDKGGEVLAPGSGNDPVQFIDARDLAEWTIRMAENRTLGVFNGTGPKEPMTTSGMLNGIKTALNSSAKFIWVPADFLAEQKVSAWGNLPVWTGADAPNNVGSSRRSIEKAIKAGLTFRPLAVTARDTLAYQKSRPAADQQRLINATQFGLTAEREAQVIAAWKAKAGIK